MSPSQKAEESELALIVQAIRRRVWIVVLCVAAATIAAAALTARAEKEYEATSALLLRASAEVEAQRAMETNLQLLALPEVAERTAQDLGGISKEEVELAVSSSQRSDSDIIQITATASEPRQAAEIANAFAEQFIAFREGGGANREKLGTGKVEIVERASPRSSPVSPKPLRNIIFGAMIGLALGIGIALLLERLDRRLKRQDDLAEATGLTLLASIPKRESYDREHLGKTSLSPAETEVFRLLRANLRYFKARSDVRSVVVTSAEPGEGKSLVSLGLAIAAVSSGERVLLVEADMRDPGLSKVLELEGTAGLSELLSGDAPIDLPRVVTAIRAGDLSETIGESRLDVIPAGAIPPNPTELVESDRMAQLLTAAEASYDLVVVDTPPVLLVADAIPLIFRVSGVLVVSGLGVSTKTSAGELADQLERLNAPTLGLVANFAEHSGRSYEGYGYGRPPELGLPS